MTQGRWTARVERDPVGIAIGLAIVAGLVALLDPSLAGLALALFALAIASYLLRHHRSRSRRSGTRFPAVALGVYASLAVGLVGYLGIPAPWQATRALALAVSAVPLALYARSTEACRPERGP